MSKAGILLLEERATLMHAMSALLRSLEYEVAQANSVATALEHLFKGAPKTDLVLASMHLQDSTSFELLRGMKQEKATESIPFILYCLGPSTLTRLSSDIIIRAARVLGAQDVIIEETIGKCDLDRRISAVLLKPAPEPE